MLFCYRIEGLATWVTGLGSCTHELSELLTLVPSDVCEKYTPKGQKCALPLGPGYYGAANITCRIEKFGRRP